MSLPRSHETVEAGSATGFLAETVVSGLSLPTDFAFAPDGRYFVASRLGDVRVYDKDGQFLDTFIKLPDVNTEYFRGLIGMTLDPDFDANGYVYLYYVHEDNAAAPEAPKTARLVRFTADGNAADPASEVILVGANAGDPAHPACRNLPANTDCIPADGVDHFGGALRFDSSGHLFLTTGDAVNNREHVQQIDRLAGKVLRLNPDGTGAENNPFFTGDNTDIQSKVWAYGFRNPFRLAIQPETNVPFVGDVGSFFWEELNNVQPGRNYGWPCYEGSAPHIYQSTLPVCVALFQSNSPTEHPLYLYPNPIFGGGAAVVSGAFYQGATYPEDYAGALFFGDFMQQTIEALQFDSDGSVLGDGPEAILTNAGNPVAMQMGPDGNVYYLTHGTSLSNGDIRRIRYEPGNRPPVAEANATPRGGLAPLTVAFESGGSHDPEGTDLLYDWDFGDGASSSLPNPTHRYTNVGSYEVLLSVEDAEGATTTAMVPIVIGDAPPGGRDHGTSFRPGL